MRIMGLDYGSKTVGVAMSDELLLTAQPLETIVRKSENKLRRTLARIEELAAGYGVSLIVVGLPLNMDDSVGERAELSLKFAEDVRRRTGLEVVMQDERLTTVSAEEVLREAGIKREDMKKYVDRIAASYILQDYLNNIKKHE